MFIYESIRDTIKTEVRIAAAKLLKTKPSFHTVEQAEKIMGNLSETSKMPCYSANLPATACKLGSRLKNVEGSVCSKCYARKGQYIYKSARIALPRRLRLLRHPHWVDAMAFLTGRKRFFRWHDSGDLQSVKHLQMIAEVARRTPNTKHWLPTKEYKMVQEFIATSEVPSNLIIRLSAFMIDGPTPDKLAQKLGVCVSGVGSKSCTCPAPAQGGACKNCRKCWTRNVFSVTYLKH